MKSNRVYLMGILALVALAICLGRVTADPTPATAPAYPTAVCNIAGVLENFEQAQDLLVKLRSIRDNLETEKEARENKIKAAQAELGELARNSEAYNELAMSMEEQSIQLRIWYETEQARAQRLHRQMTGGMLISIHKAVAQVAEQRGIQIVLNSTHMNLGQNPADQILQPHTMYAADAVDITTDVVAMLNAAYAPNTQQAQ